MQFPDKVGKKPGIVKSVSNHFFQTVNSRFRKAEIATLVITDDDLKILNALHTVVNWI